MSYDPIVKRAYDTAVAILGEAGAVRGAVLVCEIDRDGLTVAFDDDKMLPGPLAATLRRAADRIDPGA